MSTLKDNTSATPLTSDAPQGNIRRIQQDTAATVAELREFLAQARGRNPQEVLGMIAKSRLVMSTLLSAICLTAVLIVCTIIPYARSDKEDDNSPKKPVATGEQSDPETKPPAPAQDSDQAAGTGSNTERAAKELGIGESKTADPDVNPLDKELEGLLDNVD